MTLLEKLRTETRSAHESIEHAIDLERLTSSLEDYGALLKRFYGFHVMWEAVAGPTLDEPEFFEPRRKTGLLVKDLLALGLQESDIAALPLCQPTVPMANRWDVLGAMYVIEGSTLGGTLIARRTHERLGLMPESGSAYFRSYGSAVGPMWREFRDKLSDASSPDTDESVISSAQRTFQIMQDWLCIEPQGSKAAA